MKKLKSLSFALALLLLLSACAPAVTESPDLSSPIIPSTPRPDQFVFTRENFPRVDGSTSTLPMAEAIAAVLLGESIDSVSDMFAFSKTADSYRNLMYESCDIIISADPPAVIWDEYKTGANGKGEFKYESAQIALDALVFVVNAKNPINNLTTKQLQDIYTGKITNWKQLGGDDAEIIPFQRNEGSGSQTAMLKTVMAGLDIMKAPSEYSIGAMGQLMEAVRSYDDSAGAIGYSVYYYANDMKMAEGLKIIEVDGVEPTVLSIASKEYKHVIPTYSLIAKSQPANSPARILWNWLQSDEGKKLISSMGYVAVAGDNTSEVFTDWSKLTGYTPPAEKFTRLREEKLTELIPSKNYGRLYPFFSGGQQAMSYDYQAGYKMGLVTGDGMIVLDAVYSSIYEPFYIYGGQDGQSVESAKFLILNKLKADATRDSFSNTVTTIAAWDGSWVISDEFDSARIYKDNIIALDSENNTFRIYDQNGKKIFDFQSYEAKNIIDASGLYQAVYSNNGGKYFNFKRNDVEGYSYFDLDGNILQTETPDNAFYVAEPFTNGYAIVNMGEGKTGLIDESGKFILPCVYYSLDIPENLNSKAVYRIIAQKESGSYYQVIDIKGNVLYKSDADYISWFSSGNAYFAMKRISDEAPGSYYLDKSFNRIEIDGDANILPAPDGGFFIKTDDGVRLLLDGKTRTISCDSIAWIKNGYIGCQLEDGGFFVLDPAGKELLRFNAQVGSKGGDYPSYQQVDVVTDSVTGENYLMHPAQGNYYSAEIYDFSGKLIITGANSGYWPINGLFRCEEKGLIGFKNTENQWVFAIKPSNPDA